MFLKIKRMFILILPTYWAGKIDWCGILIYEDWNNFLTLLIPSIISSRIPLPVFVMDAASFRLILISLLLILAGVAGMYLLKGNTKSTTKSLSWATLFPALIAVSIVVFGDHFITSLANHFKALEPVVEYLLSGVPRTWYLIMSYVVIAAGWFLLSRKVR